jgi:hypothetical protein
MIRPFPIHAASGTARVRVFIGNAAAGAGKACDGKVIKLADDGTT